MKILIPVLFAICFLVSCSVEKRHYMEGYHIEWKHNKESATTELKAKFDKKTSSYTAFAPEKITKDSITRCVDPAIQPNNITSKENIIQL